MFLHGRKDQGQDTNLTATITRCDFIDNVGLRGGAVYAKSTSTDSMSGDMVMIDDCKFLSNVSNDGAGAICASDKLEVGSTELLICSSIFVANYAKTKGGAVYNRGGATTTMVNCIVAGNKADSLGGGTCNADDFVLGPTATTTFNLHNCLLAGNWAATPGNQGGGHLNRHNGVSELINCTVVLNEAFGNYGGIENVGDAGVLEVQNCIVWGNADGGGNGGKDNQLHFSVNDPQGLEVDGNVIEDCTGTCFPGSGTNKGDDPVFLDGGTNATWNGSASYDGNTGQTTFKNMSLGVYSHADKLFKPDSGGVEYLLIISNTTTEIVCLGKTAETSRPGEIFDPHICECGFTHAAIDFGGDDHLPPDDDICDLDGQVNNPDRLPLDLYLNDRDQGDAPDAGVHEVDPG